MAPRPLAPVTIGMPQMTCYGLSENWLLRHLGDVHWTLICDALGRRSRDMVDRDGNRLYASFVRVSWMSTLPLSAYRESDTLSGSIDIARYGDGMFISTAKLLGSPRGEMDMRLASIFTRREGTANDRLIASAPPIFDDCPIPNVDAIPHFLEQHRVLRAGQLDIHMFMNTAFDIRAPIEETIPYAVNGYYDFNGANLLYFASYPTIADICASQTNFVAENFGFARFVERSSPIGRDTFYFGNANLGDPLTCGFALRHVDFGTIGFQVDLVRSDTGALIGKQFGIRTRP
jgi:probable biosynthetic protein (TIGR04098 family)